MWVEDEEVAKLESPLERLWALRDERLRALIAHAQQHSRWHADRLEGVDPAGIDAVSLERLPVMDKRDLMMHWDEIATDPGLTLDKGGTGVEGYEFVTTGRSTGTPTVVAWDMDGHSLETRLGPGATVTTVDTVEALASTPAGKRKRFIGF